MSKSKDGKKSRVEKAEKKSHKDKTQHGGLLAEKSSIDPSLSSLFAVKVSRSNRLARKLQCFCNCYTNGRAYTGMSAKSA